MSGIEAKTGNISKSKGFKGDTGAIGPTGPQGVQGEKGDTPSIVLRLESNGNLYYSSDGILLDKEYVESQNFLTKTEADEKDGALQSQIDDINTNLETKADKEDTYPKTEIEERLPKIISIYTPIDINTLYGYQYLTNPTMYLIQENGYGQGEFLFVYSSAKMIPPDYVEEEFATYQVRFTDTGVQYRMNPSWSVARWTEWVAYATTKDIETKADKTTVEKSTDSAYAFEFSNTDNKSVRMGEAETISFTFGNGEYSESYMSELSFDSGSTPTAIDYTDSGILNWVGTDCTTVDGLSIFQPSANTHYDIVFYFNGTQFIGLVNGFVPSVSR